MSEMSPRREFGFDDQEACPEIIREFMLTIQEKLAGEPSALYDPDEGGITSWCIDREAADTLTLEFRAPGSDNPFITDFMTGKGLPEAVAYFSRRHKEYRLADDPLSIHAETEDIWVFQSGEELRLRRRVYDYEQPNYRELEKMDAEGGSAMFESQLRRFQERIRAQLARQPANDAEEELLGLNRLTNREVEERIALMRSDLEPTAEII